ncbi:MAG: nucleotidyltransferase family protein [Candidatus Syntropharchaeia archaeon]
MESVILDGNICSELISLTSARSPPLLNVPIIAHVAEYLEKSDVDKITVLGDTLDAKRVSDPLIVIKGSIITDFDLKKIVEFHEECGALLTMGLMPVSDPWNHRVAEIEEDGCIENIIEKSATSLTNLADAGIYVLDPEAVDYISSRFFHMEDLFDVLLREGEIYGYLLHGFWADAGNLDGYTRAKEWLMWKRETKISNSSVIEGKVSGNVTIGEDVFVGDSIIIGPAVIGNGVIVEDGCIVGINTSIGENSRIEKGCRLWGSVIFDDALIGERSKLDACFIGEGAEIKKGAEIEHRAVVGSNSRVGYGTKINRNVFIEPSSFVRDFMTFERILCF